MEHLLYAFVGTVRPKAKVMVCVAVDQPHPVCMGQLPELPHGLAELGRGSGAGYIQISTTLLQVHVNTSGCGED